MKPNGKDIIYGYPKSSCVCWNCDTRKDNFTDVGIPTNLAVVNCQIPPVLDCYERRAFKSDMEPVIYPDVATQKDYTYLNPELAQKKFDPTFYQLNCKSTGKSIGTCDTVYASTDPRLIYTPTAQLLPLDRPPWNDNVRLSDVYNPDLTNYGKNYATYTDINAGQIMYYTDRTQKDPFFKPNFVDTVRMSGMLYKDPMGAIKPEYNRHPLKCNNPITSEKDSYDTGLSSIEDSQFQRQDIMALQMRKHNQERWMPRW